MSYRAWTGCWKLLGITWAVVLVCDPNSLTAEESPSARTPSPNSPSVETQILVPTPIQADELRKHVEYLAQPALEGRGSAKGRRLAAQYILREFKALHLQPAFGDTYLQEVPGVRKEDGSQDIWGMNLAAVLPGAHPQRKEEYLILSAHYDHLGIRGETLFPGADDNASSIAMMLACARQLATQKQRPDRTIVFVAFDLEEHLLWGSRWFAAHPPWPLERVKLFITADLLGRSLGDLPLPAVFVMGAEHGTGLPEYFRRLQPPGTLELAPLGADLVGTRSDYGPFRDEKVPFLFFSTGEHPDYHTPQDTPDRIQYDKLSQISNVILQLVRDQAATETPPTWSKSAPPSLDEARTIHRITQLLLDAEQQEGRKLTSLQKFLVTQTHQKTQQLLEKGTVTPDERVWLVRSAQALLLSVF